jgi:hypothetical protein
VTFLAIACVLVGLHLAGEVAAFVHADGRGNGIRKHRIHQILNALVPFDFNELAELRFAKCVRRE